jgi:hypothetical protein
LRHIPCRYSKLFDWLVETINAQRPSKGLYTISVLDIFGFEVFDVNSLEQLCINFCNEKLQKNFTDTIFELEQGQYKKEGVAFERVEFVDNHLVISLIESELEWKQNKEGGILQIIQSEIEIGDIATDKNLIERLKVLKQSPDVRASGVFKDVRDSQFVVKHYAGEVKYSIDGLREKSVLELGSAAQLLRETGAPFVKQLLGAHEGENQRQKEAQRGHGGGSGGKGRKKHTVGLAFKDDLKELIKTIETTKPHYVRCIKPNEKRSPSDFDERLTLQQLKCMLARGGLNRKAPFATAAHPNPWGGSRASSPELTHPVPAQTPGYSRRSRCARKDMAFAYHTGNLCTATCALILTSGSANASGRRLPQMETKRTAVPSVRSFYGGSRLCTRVCSTACARLRLGPP